MFDKSSQKQAPFASTHVDLCYSTSAIQLVFTAFNETNFFYNSSMKTNDPIYDYEVRCPI